MVISFTLGKVIASWGRKKDKKAHKNFKGFSLQIVLAKLHLDELSVKESKPYGLAFFKNKHWFKNWGKFLEKVGFSLHRLQIFKNNIEKFDKPKHHRFYPFLIIVFSLYIM